MIDRQRLRRGVFCGLSAVLLGALPAGAQPRSAVPAAQTKSQQPVTPVAGPKAAGTKGAVKAAPAPKPVKEEESSEGVKTYEFGAVEVEGRLRSPQILYFLRRVRAEFDADALGHRSFLRELADTRNDSSFR